jgi:hypothetical protein
LSAEHGDQPDPISRVGGSVRMLIRALRDAPATFARALIEDCRAVDGRKPPQFG